MFVFVFNMNGLSADHQIGFYGEINQVVCLVYICNLFFRDSFLIKKTDGGGQTFETIVSKNKLYIRYI